MTWLHTGTLISLLIAGCVSQNYDAGSSAVYDTETSRSVDSDGSEFVRPTQPMEYSPNLPKKKFFMCRESTPNYDCIFTNVIITRDSAIRSSFGFQDPASNNQSRIAFKQSSMQILPASLLQSFRKVELIDLTELQMEEIASYAFYYGSSIKELYLSFNYIQSLPQNAFAGLTSLETLVMDRSNLSSLELNTFTGTPNLKVLSMSNNNLERIEDGTFRSTPALEDLQMASNKLTHFDLSLIPSLYSANVSFNQLTVISLPANIASLDASHNRISSVVGKTNNQHYNHLVSLILHHNSLADTAWLLNFPSLIELDLSYNELEEFSAINIRFENYLNTLRLQHNRLLRLSLPNTMLRVLDVSYNMLVHVEANHKQFNTLQQLRLDHNAIVTLKIAQDNLIHNLTMAHNDWDCSNLRNHSFLMAKVLDAEQSCNVDYQLHSGLCCKDTPKPYLDRLNEQIKKTSFAEKLNRAADRCSPTEALSSVQNLSHLVQQNEEELRSLQNRESEVVLLQKEKQKLDLAVQQRQRVFNSLHTEVDSNIRRYRIAKEGLVKPSVNLANVFKHLADRADFKQQESNARVSEAKQKLEDAEALKNDNEEQNKKIEATKVKTTELRAKMLTLRSKVKQMEARKNANAKTQHQIG